MKKTLFILLALEMLLAAALGRLGHLDRPATLEWKQHPTPETRRALSREKQVEEVGRAIFSAAVFTVMAGATLFGYWRVKGDPFGLIVKRFGTAAGLFAMLFPVSWFGFFLAIAVIAGARAEANRDKGGFVENDAGVKFVRSYGAAAFGVALGTAYIASAAAAFSGLLPWCRAPRQPLPGSVPEKEPTAC